MTLSGPEIAHREGGIDWIRILGNDMKIIVVRSANLVFRDTEQQGH
jgi:hypothetical protein